MALGSQQGNVDALTDITGLVHSIFVGSVLPGVRWESVTAQLYMDAQEGDYRFDGQNLNGATDLLRPHGAIGSTGMLPDGNHQDAANWQTTPKRRYVRRAIDNFVGDAAVSGPGSFADLGTRLFDQMWGAWRLMEIRHAIGGSDGVICVVDSRTSSTVWVGKDGYNHTGTSPMMLLDENMVICWMDITASNAAAGAGAISSIAYSTNTVTMDSGTTWEPSATLASGDLICAATTTNIATDYFESEYTNANNGQPQVIDPDAASTTVFNVPEGTYPRWKPPRKVSGTFDHLEVTEFYRHLAAKSTSPVTSDSHVGVVAGGTFATLARTLIGFQQQQNLGRVLEGGYQTIRVAGHDFAVDDFQLHDVMSVYCVEDLYTVSLTRAGYFDQDGSMYSRIADFDGKEWFAREYSNSFCPVRGRNGAITSITLDSAVTADDYTPVPDY